MNRISPRPSPVRSRRAVIAAAGILAGGVLAVAAPLAASAHVEVSPVTAPAGGTTRLTFQFHHACDASPTTALVITIPDGVASTMPVYEGGWTIKRTLGANGLPTQVTFTADSPIPTETSASVAMDVLFRSTDTGKRIAFPVVQKCVSGSTAWVQIPESGQDPESLANPAPAVTIGPKGLGDEDDVDGPVASASPSVTASPASASSPTAAAEPDPVARWLGA
ncbi:MAG TPA: DUF1775 domain-containing protein, partial [Microbacterium sp.]|uniref:DUF1775 domain-containing protein n=1 Tax=Microbacterium sp. TaxID=51671 RepID=UPI002B49B567